MRSEEKIMQRQRKANIKTLNRKQSRNEQCTINKAIDLKKKVTQLSQTKRISMVIKSIGINGIG